MEFDILVLFVERFRLSLGRVGDLSYEIARVKRGDLEFEGAVERFIGGQQVFRRLRQGAVPET